jgi:hypothetical protein
METAMITVIADAQRREIPGLCKNVICNQVYMNFSNALTNPRYRLRHIN